MPAFCDAASLVNGIDLTIDGGQLTGTRFATAVAGRKALHDALKADAADRG